MKKLLILGSGGHSKVVAETALATGIYKEIFFLDDKYLEKNDFKKSSKNIIGSLDESLKIKQLDKYKNAVVALGDCRLRIKWIKKLIDFGYELPTIIHPSSQISKSCFIDYGTVVFANSVVQSDAKIGKGVILNTSCSIDHDSVVNNGTHISPGVNIAGNVSIGDESWIGIGASIIEGINLGKRVTVGAGSVVIKNFPDGVKIAGVPCKVIT